MEREKSKSSISVGDYERRFEKKNDDKIEYEFQELGLEMQKFYPEKQRNWMWSLFWKYPIHDIRRAHEQTVKYNVASVAYLCTVLRKPYDNR